MTKFIEAELDKDWNWTTTHKFNGVNVYVCGDSEQAYNLSQGLPQTDNNAILYIPSENIVGVVNTWPIAVTKKAGHLHTPNDWKTIGNDKVSYSKAHTYIEKGITKHIPSIKSVQKGYKFKKAVEFTMVHEKNHIDSEALKASK
jgi:hypothetical protein